MVTILKSGAPSESIQKVLDKLSSRKPKKGIDAQKYCGAIVFKEDGLVLQKRWRDEWE
jgi:effector-binding domain-containing protein